MKTATPQLARAINDRLALDLLLERGPLTAPQLRALTGLSRPTVSDLIERLQVEGLIRVTGESGGDRRGPNARLYGIVADRAFVGGVDVRRDVVDVTVADITGATVGAATRPLGENLPALVAQALTEAAGSRPLHAVVIGAPGMVDPQTGDLAAGNVEPAWRPGLLPALRTLVDAPVTMENEVNLAAVAEHATGAAAGRDDFVLLWLDDGVGAAVVLDGRLRRGASGGAGEIGFLGRLDIRVCEALGPEAVRGLDLPALAERVVTAAFALVAVLDPGLVVLGGATSLAGGDPLATLVAERLAEVSPVPVHVRVSAIPDNPVLRGAVSTALSIARDAVFGQGRR
ncbi:ROK family transcriptional regulator [Microbispora bryophytorum]|uniref:ROK family transcriptional regulator n=1 Tax=Microbispora bryophytorum subsp. camponoti TaxID=1677852 RepID=A0ABR8L691_9ACTN|nr:ROK family transcriptional regulator [Microbispora camponoti]MBD3144024.1 ROK family transcriptional regulator [Microbispora camponoti]